MYLVLQNLCQQMPDMSSTPVCMLCHFDASVGMVLYTTI